jgi:hypothetical protein
VISGAPSALLVSSPTRNNNNERVGDGRQDRYGNDGQMFRQPAFADGYVRPAGDPGFGRDAAAVSSPGPDRPSEIQCALQFIGEGECKQ